MEFPQTEWSVIVKASLNGSGGGRGALEKLCRDYHAPVREFLRIRGHTHEQAEDVTQEFFRRLLESEGWKRADRTRGKFRTFLLGMLMRVLIDLQRRERAEKRGGGVEVLSLDEAGAAEPVDGETALAFDTGWAAHLVSESLGELETAWLAKGRKDEFEVLALFLPVGGGTAPDPVVAAERLGLSSGGLRSSVHRLRAEFREAVRSRIARTVAEPQDVAEEMEHLCAVMLQPGFDEQFAAIRAQREARA